MSVHVVKAPTLESGSPVVGMVTVHLNHLVEDTTSQIQVLVAHVVSQNEEYLLDAVTVLEVSGNMVAISNKNIAALYARE